MRQPTLTDGFEKYRKKTRKEQFLEEMETIIPWQELTAVIAPFYPNPQGAGRRPVGVERMLRIYIPAALLQCVRPRRRGGTVRLPRHAALRGH
jgi:hypothetical protein